MSQRENQIMKYCESLIKLQIERHSVAALIISPFMLRMVNWEMESWRMSTVVTR